MKEGDEIKSVAEFVAWINEINEQLNGVKILYRGQSSYKWLVSPSLCRRPGLGRKKITKNHELWERTNVILRTAEGLGYYEKEKGQEHDCLSLLAHLQHFGTATCLVDFTRSPLVALWFACQPHAQKHPGRVVSINTSMHSEVSADNRKGIMEKWKEQIYGDYPNDNSFLKIWKPEQQNNRVIVQQSEFVLGATVIEPDETCIIPDNKKQEILSDLKRIGLTEESLFPDPDGFAHTNSHDKPFLYMDGVWCFEKGVECKESRNIREHKRAIELFRLAKEQFKKRTKSEKILLNKNSVTVKNAIDLADKQIKNMRKKIKHVEDMEKKMIGKELDDAA